jgi:glycosyltransferase involved in cell wall biosynthesis
VPAARAWAPGIYRALSMRILLVGDYPPDPRLGSTKVLFKLQEEFRRLGHECDLLLADGLGSWPRNNYLRQALGPMLAWRAVRRATADRGAYDVIDVASAEGLWLARARTGAGGPAIIARSNGLEHLNYQRMLEDAQTGGRRKPWFRRVFHPVVRLSQVAAAARAADRLLLLNDGDRAFVVNRRWKPDSAIDVVPHGVSSALLAEAPGPGQPRGRGILFCGSWSEVKGITYLADAFSRLVRAGTKVNLTVLGGAVPEATIRLSFSSAARASLTVVDRVPEAEVMNAYRLHDVLAWPSTYEGFGMVLVEAMSQRLPVVATSVGCAGSLVRSEHSGLTVPKRDAGALAAALGRMLNDPALRARCAAAAFDRVRGMSWTSTAKQTLEVYERARAGRLHV